MCLKSGWLWEVEVKVAGFERCWLTKSLIYGFAKNAKANISTNELKGLRAYADTLLSYTDKELSKAVKSGALIEVESDG